jgi:Protein of unknown function (DUF2846)
MLGDPSPIIDENAYQRENTMFQRALIGAVVIFTSLLSGCASVPMAPPEQDTARKQFSAPAADKSGVYIFRNSFVGQALKKRVSVDGTLLGETANKTYFYREVSPGSHTISTESEFGDNTVTLQAEAGKNYFVRQYIKMGVFTGGAALQMVSEEDGKKEVLECKLAQ